MRTRRIRKKNSFDLEMNSILDVLIIIVFFLIISSSNNTVEIDIQNDIEIAKSTSQEAPNDIISIKVDNKNNIWIDNEK
jgi:biopolymer transport protein ExbD